MKIGAVRHPHDYTPADTPRPRHTPTRNVRVDDATWKAAKAAAARRGESVSDVIRRALIAYAEGAAEPRTETVYARPPQLSPTEAAAAGILAE